MERVRAALGSVEIAGVAQRRIELQRPVQIREDTLGVREIVSLERAAVVGPVMVEETEVIPAFGIGRIGFRGTTASSYRSRRKLSSACSFNPCTCAGERKASRKKDNANNRAFIERGLAYEREFAGNRMPEPPSIARETQTKRPEPAKSLQNAVSERRSVAGNTSRTFRRSRATPRQWICP